MHLSGYKVVFDWMARDHDDLEFTQFTIASIKRLQVNFEMVFSSIIAWLNRQNNCMMHNTIYKIKPTAWYYPLNIIILLRL